ncbi:CLASP protein [Operophtera brumata]|uniref:CLASP protein n=1 Tax=Operophtera brumata TaxID=104452 RepID=A0A0L7LMI6_OPEBR|nr:CLASP protein [Operophtera brumata]
MDTTTPGLREVEVLEALCKLDGTEAPPAQLERLLLATHEAFAVASAGRRRRGLFLGRERLIFFNKLVSVSGWGTANERAAAEAVKVLIWLCRRPETRPQWQEYFDLILLKLINAYESLNKEVMRAVEGGMPHIASALPPHQVSQLVPHTD